MDELVKPDSPPVGLSVTGWSKFTGWGGQESQIAWIGDVRVGRIELDGEVWRWYSAMPSEDDPIDGVADSMDAAKLALDEFNRAWLVKAGLVTLASVKAGQDRPSAAALEYRDYREEA
jgi:hypothetical protein